MIPLRLPSLLQPSLPLRDTDGNDALLHWLERLDRWRQIVRALRGRIMIILRGARARTKRNGSTEHSSA